MAMTRFILLLFLNIVYFVFCFLLCIFGINYTDNLNNNNFIGSETPKSRGIVK
jgi:TRAP-type C4-dicarboxylate transport system permease small subunit